MALSEADGADEAETIQGLCVNCHSLLVCRRVALDQLLSRPQAVTGAGHLLEAWDTLRDVDAFVPEPRLSEIVRALKQARSVNLGVTLLRLSALMASGPAHAPLKAEVKAELRELAVLRASPASMSLRQAITLCRRPALR